MSDQHQHPHSLRDLVLYFLKLGATGFGGPVALIGYMHRDLVVEHKWYTEEEYKEGLTLAQLAPGPLASQLGTYLAFLHYGYLGATLASVAFVLPSFLMVVALGIAYKVFNGLPWMQAAFYGVGGSVVGIVAISSYRLTTKSVGDFTLESFRTKWLLWLFFLSTFALTFISQAQVLWVFIGAGLFYMFLKSPPDWFGRGKAQANALWLIASAGFWRWDSKLLRQMAIFFTKAGGFVFGSGLAIIPFLHATVTDYHWIDEKTFLDAVAVAMITPGPVLITVAFIGYLTQGLPGALVAAFFVFLPAFLITIIVAPYFKRIAQNKSIKAFVQGITAAVIGAIAGSVVMIAIKTFAPDKIHVDPVPVIICILTVLTLLYVKKMREPYVILTAAVIGILVRYLL